MTVSVLKQTVSTNLFGHWKEFYAVFYATLAELDKQELIPILKKEEEHRGTVESVSKLFTDNGFKVSRHFEDSFEMKFLNGTAFLNHHFIKLGWLAGWLKLFPKEELPEIFSALQRNLNTYAKQNFGLILTVPMAFVEGEKL